MSELSPLARVGGGPGLRAAFVGPSGAEEGLMVVPIPELCEPNEGGLVGDCGVGVLSDKVESESN